MRGGDDGEGGKAGRGERGERGRGMGSSVDSDAVGIRVRIGFASLAVHRGPKSGRREGFGEVHRTDFWRERF